MNEIILSTKQLTKQYGSFTALNGADFSVCRGDICGLIGRNGAGKTTLMKLVTGLTEPTSGSYQLFGKDSTNSFLKRRIGCLIENPAFFGSMTAFQNLKFYCLQKGITDMKKIDEVLELVSLTDARNKKFKTFSLGMKQRLGIAFAMLDDPDIVILDEPINGLDPIGIAELRDTFRTLNRERGMTFIISSHILSELYAVADHFVFIEKGRLIKSVTKQELDLECSRCIVVKCGDVKHASTVIDSLGITNYKVIDKSELRIYEEGVSAKELNKQLVTNGVEVEGLTESGVSLEDYFKQLVSENN